MKKNKIFLHLGFPKTIIHKNWFNFLFISVSVLNNWFLGLFLQTDLHSDHIHPH